jgi:hypothetical protein
LTTRRKIGCGASDSHKATAARVQTEEGWQEGHDRRPGLFLVLGFEEIHEDYGTPEFVKKYEGEGKKVELEGAGRRASC